MPLSWLSTGEAQPSHYNLGRGIIYFGSRNATTGYATSFRDLGNATEFNISLTKEELEHFSSRSGLKVIDKKVVLSQAMTFNFTLDECNFDNMALFFSGTVASRNCPVIDYHTGQTGNGNLWMEATNHKGRWYDLYEGADLTAAYPPSNPNSKRVFNIDPASFVLELANGTTVVSASEYLIDALMGRVFIKSTSTIPANEKCDCHFKTLHTGGSLVIEEIAGLTQAAVTGALKFISDNAANNFKVQYQFHRATVSAEGDFALIGDQYSTMKFTGTAEKDEAVDPTFPVLRVSSFGQ